MLQVVSQMGIVFRHMRYQYVTDPFPEVIVVSGGRRMLEIVSDNQAQCIVLRFMFR
jgi:hypothetical protein